MSAGEPIPAAARAALDAATEAALRCLDLCAAAGLDPSDAVARAAALRERREARRRDPLPDDPAERAALWATLRLLATTGPVAEEAVASATELVAGPELDAVRAWDREIDQDRSAALDLALSARGMGLTVEWEGRLELAPGLDPAPEPFDGPAAEAARRLAGMAAGERDAALRRGRRGPWG